MVHPKRTSCSRCRSLKEKCQPITTANGEIDIGNANSCARCFRVKWQPCEVDGKPWKHHLLDYTKSLEKWQLSAKIVETSPSNTNSPMTSPSVDSPFNDDENDTLLSIAYESTNLEIPTFTNLFQFYSDACRQLSQMIHGMISIEDLAWLSCHHFWKIPSLENVLSKTEVVQHWLSKPFVIAGILTSTLSRRTGKLIAPDVKSIQINPLDLDKLADFMTTTCIAIMSHLAKTETFSFPIIDLVDLLTSTRLITLQYGRVIVTKILLQHCLSINLIKQYQFHEMDSNPSQNSYLQQLTQLPYQRNVLRRCIWALMFEDLIWQGLPGGQPRLPPESVIQLRPPFPDIYLNNPIDDSMDDWYKLPNLEWIYLDRDHPDRINGLKIATDLFASHLTLFGCLVHVITSGISTIRYKKETTAFLPFPTYLNHSLQFYLELIQDVYSSFPSPLQNLVENGQISDIVHIISKFHDVPSSIRFLLLWARLLDSRIQCESWSPGLAILKPCRKLNDKVSELAWKLIGKPRKVKELREPNLIVSRDLPFSLLQEASLENVLADSILLSEILGTSMQLLSTSFVRTGHSHLGQVIRVAVLHLSVLSQLYNVNQVQMIGETILHIQTLMNFCKLLLTNTYAIPANQQPPWTEILKKKLANFDGITQEWLKEFYGSTIADVT